MEEVDNQYEHNQDSSFILRKDDEYVASNKVLLMVKATDEVKINVFTQNGCEYKAIKGYYLFFFDRRVRLCVLNNYCDCKSIRLESLTGLLVFMDAANGTSEDSACESHWGMVTTGLKSEHFENDNELKKWLMYNNLKKEKTIQQLLNFIRKSEEYQLVSFLLKNTIGNNTIPIKNLCRTYGLSYSHFRRLCYKALGGPVKEELEKWKVMNAYLDCVEDKDSLTFHAINNGFSSSSHFSNAIKKFIGYSPRDLKNINFIKKMAKKNG